MSKYKTIVTSLIGMLTCALIFAMPNIAKAAAVSVDDWVMQDHDMYRSGLQLQNTGITKTNVHSLKLRWAVPLGELVYSSPLVANGTVYIATGKGNVYALKSSNGSIIWKTNIGDYIRMSPTLQDGLLFVGNYGINNGPLNHTQPTTGAMAALNAKTGKIVWRVPVKGLIRSAPVVIHSVVYEGIAGGDGWNGCFAGHIAAFDEHTGKSFAVWYTSTKPNNGGGIFGPLSYDGQYLYFGTGDTCDGTGAQESIVSISLLNMKTHWITSAHKLMSPELTKLTEQLGGQDVGCGVLIRGERLYCKGKSGILYVLDKNTGKKLWQQDLQPFSGVGSGGIGTPTGDGTMIFANSGEHSYGGKNDGTTDFIAFDFAGHQKYILKQHSAMTLAMSAAFVPSIGFVPFDNSMRAFDAHTGNTLWSYTTKDEFYASPAIVPSGLYGVDLSGNVYAFGLTKTELVTVAPNTLQQLVNPDKAANNKPHYKKIIGAGLTFSVIIGLISFFFTKKRVKKLTEPQP